MAKLEFTREELQRLHNEGKPDSEIALLYDMHEVEISQARKRSSYWEAKAKPSSKKAKAKAELK